MLAPRPEGLNGKGSPVKPISLAAWMVAAMVLVVPIAARSQTIAQDQEAIRQIARKTWDRPDAPLAVDPIVVVRGYAISAWTQGDQGGRALLRKGKDGWEVILCSGDQLRDPDTSQAAGVPSDIAKELVAKLLEAEKLVSSDRLARFALFEGILRMDAPHSDPAHKH